MFPSTSFAAGSTNPKLVQVRSMESYEGDESHPYGVLPSGNAYFATRSEMMVRYHGLGPLLCKLSDEQISEVLGFLSGPDLVRVLQTSRTLYCHTNSSDLWRDVTLREFDGISIKYQRSWKDAYMHTFLHRAGSSLEVSNHKPIPMKGVFSTYLHRSWSCHTCDLATACPGFFEHSDLPVRSAKELTVEAFIEEYEKPNRPLLIRDAVQSTPLTEAEAAAYGDRVRYCPALAQWSNSYLEQQCGPSSRLRATSAAAALPAHFTAAEYFQYATQAREEAPLYLFEKNFASLAPGLLRDYEVPVYFRDNKSNSGGASSSAGIAHVCATGDAAVNAGSDIDGANSPDTDSEHASDNGGSNVPRAPSDQTLPDAFNLPASSAMYATDLFRLLGEDGRPDYRWLVAGPARSGSLFHIDPNQTNAWNLCIRGCKKWIFYPPNVSPPGVESSADGADVVVPISTGEWLLTFWQYHLDARRDADPSRRPLEILQRPGEVVFVPHGYWHMVVNLEESVALTHNYVSTSNLADCLRFLREKTEQISGVGNRNKDRLQPEDVYATFVKNLATVLPATAVEACVEQSRKPAATDLNDPVKARLLLLRANSLKRKRCGKGLMGGTGAEEGATKKGNGSAMQPEGSAGCGQAGECSAQESGGVVPSTAFSFGFSFE